MIAVDSSALVAIVLGEPEAESMALALANERALVTAANLVEASIVVEARQGPDAARDLRLIVDAGQVEVVSVDDALASEAFACWRRFGKGRHRAGLNFGDCFSYALARSQGIPLLFKGHDFARTDIEPVLSKP